ncbi:MAG: nucleoside hydrolase [Pseudomonadota bacterium]
MQVVLDTDPGVDDILALLWLLALDVRYKADVIGITTAEGNLRRRATFNNACRVLDLCRRTDLTLAKSASHAGKTAEHLNGVDGLVGLTSSMPAPSKSYESAPRAPQLLERWLSDEGNEVTLLATGPVTNLEAVEVMSKGSLGQAKHIVATAGTFMRGNVTPEAEFNAHFNPRALHRLFHANANVTLIPLDVSRQFDLNLDHLRAAGFDEDVTRVSRFVWRLVGATQKHLMSVDQPRFCAADATAVAFAFYPELFETVSAYVKIETRANLETTGKTFIEPHRTPNVSITRRVNIDRVREQMLSDLKQFSAMLR